MLLALDADAFLQEGVHPCAGGWRDLAGRKGGKLSLLAAMFDERIAAVMPAACGSGACTPWRYTAHKYAAENIERITRLFPSWYHPRFRFFSNNEFKLPIDQNLLLACVAPRGLMMTVHIHNPIGNAWGSETCYRSVKRVYDLLGAGDRLHRVLFRLWQCAVS